MSVSAGAHDPVGEGDQSWGGSSGPYSACQAESGWRWPSGGREGFLNAILWANLQIIVHFEAKSHQMGTIFRKINLKVGCVTRIAMAGGQGCTTERCDKGSLGGYLGDISGVQMRAFLFPFFLLSRYQLDPLGKWKTRHLTFSFSWDLCAFSMPHLLTVHMKIIRPILQDKQCYNFWSLKITVMITLVAVIISITTSLDPSVAHHCLALQLVSRREAGQGQSGPGVCLRPATRCAHACAAQH